MGDIGVSVDGRGSISVILGQAEAAENAGASSCWIASHLFQHDPFTLAGMALEATNHIRVVLMAVSPYVVHPVQIAMATATLASRYPDRVCLCLGVGVPGDLNAAGLQPIKPRATLRDTIVIVRALLCGEPPMDGDVFAAPSRALSVLPSVDVPIHLAASGPRMLALAGECADGVVLSAGASPPFIQTALKRATASGNGIQRFGLIYCGAANRILKRHLGNVLSGAHHRENILLGGTGLNQERLRSLLNQGAVDEAISLITDDVIAAHTAAGPLNQTGARLAAFSNAGLDEVVLAGLNSAETTYETVSAALSAAKEV